MTSDYPNQNNANVTVNVNTPNSRGAGTVLMIVLFWWVLVGFWWPLLIAAWLTWMVIAAITAIFDHGDLWRGTWYQPLPIWLFGIR